ncbi:hypothetical protein LL033_03105 [Clostridium estertheticum]|uniref:hypothetical protein n=1 Tax=Clostridium estertheticum TaxID=238834 RepID=UPI001C0E8CAD|nr:hypothetical protein [Clostridium estertheticum]MBU3215502.1 hypothetical protein [Clostridium estertheticum]WAG56243.1 hypothetical protein LL033_03105 [Clostridium estertheticum]
MAGSDLNYAIIKIQTLLWETASGQKIYISVFPAFIIKYNKISTDLIEFISTNVGRGENVFNFIDDSGNLLECEDILIRSCQRVNTTVECKKIAALLNAKYTEIFNTTLKCIKFNDYKRSNLRFKDTLILFYSTYYRTHYMFVNKTNECL